MKKNLLYAILAMAGLAASAEAQVSTSFGDLILAFRVTDGQAPGANINLEVDLGSVSQFYNQPQGTKLTVSRLAAADLAATYGNNWASRTDLVWGIIGTDSRTSTGPESQPAATIWATRAELTTGTQSNPFTPGSYGAQATPCSLIEPLYIAEPGSLNGQQATPNSPYSSSINATLNGSYSVEQSWQPGESFAYFTPSIENNVVSSGYSVSDLYELRPGAANATYLGSFGLSASGVLTFSTSVAGFSGGNETFTLQPASQTIASGSTVVFKAVATGTPAPTYQWYYNGSAISNATSSTYVITGANSTNAGNYSVTVTNSSGTASSNSATLTVVGTTNNPGRLVNLSMLSDIQGSLSMGFVNGGSGTSGNESLLIRGVGPSIGPGTTFNVPGVMTDPTLTITEHGVTAPVATNTKWGSSASNISAVQAADTATGAFPLTNTSSADSALVSSFAPGQYAATVQGASGDNGFALTEVYDNTGSAYTAASTRLVNLSCLTTIAAGGQINVGFVLGGTTSKTILVRVSGPSIGPGTAFNVPGVMPDPTLAVSLLSSTSTVFGSNAGWGGDASITAAANAVGAFPWATSSSKDSAVLVTLQPNIPYAVTVTSASGAGGSVLVELYEVP